MSENFLKCRTIYLIKESTDLENFKVVKKKGFTYGKIKSFHVEGSQDITAFTLCPSSPIHYCFSLEKMKKKHWRTFIGIWYHLQKNLIILTLVLTKCYKESL